MTEGLPLKVEDIQFPDEMARMSFITLADLINERNSEVGKINAVKGDRSTLQEQIEEDSTDPEVVEARKARDEAKALYDEAVMALYDIAKPKVDEVLEDAEASVKKFEDDIKKHDEAIKPGLTYFKKMYGENLAKNLPPLARLKGFTTKGAGSTGRRVRGYTIDVTADGETTGYDNLASAAKSLDLETTQLQELFFEAAGNPAKLKDAPDRVDFSVEYVETYEDESTEIKTAHIVATRTEKANAVPVAPEEVEETEDYEDTESEWTEETEPAFG